MKETSKIYSEACKQKAIEQSKASYGSPRITAELNIKGFREVNRFL
jgi:hypothetical protein